MQKKETSLQRAFDFENPPEYPEPLHELPPALLANILGVVEEQSRFVHQVHENIVVRSPADAARYLTEHIFTPFRVFDQEELWVLLLNTKNRVTHAVMVYRGGLNTVYIRLGELFKEAVRVNAAGIIISHVHPSGDPTPSPEDVRVTEDANQAAKLLGIDLLDHIIVGENIWVSLKERGLGL